MFKSNPLFAEVYIFRLQGLNYKWKKPETDMAYGADSFKVKEKKKNPQILFPPQFRPRVVPVPGTT